jgi:hypothetical protein
METLRNDNKHCMGHMSERDDNLNTMVGYRICEKRDGKLLTLFHRTNGTRELPLNRWIKADVREVRDGSRPKAKPYLSGFHFLFDIDECRDFIKMFRKQRHMVLVECRVKDIWKKNHSRSNVFLTRYMKITRELEQLHITNNR